MSEQLFDVAIIGGGPAGMTAAIYAQRAMLSSIVFEKALFGGQMTLTSDVDNYPGEPHADGYTLGESMLKQVKELGAETKQRDITHLERCEDGIFKLEDSRGETYLSKTVIVATGATPRRAGFEGEEAFSGKGVSYCATCDGMFFMNKQVFVIGGGNSAAEEALFLTRFASHVTVVVRKDHLRAQKVVVKELEEHPKIDIAYETQIVRVEGEMGVKSVTLLHTNTQQEETRTFDEGCGIFVFVGRTPESSVVATLMGADAAQGYLEADERMQTEVPGLFIAGDVRDKPLRQIVTAASDGAQAATSAAIYLGQPVEG